MEENDEMPAGEFSGMTGWMYPFVIVPAIMGKLIFIHNVCREVKNLPEIER